MRLALRSKHFDNNTQRTSGIGDYIFMMLIANSPFTANVHFRKLPRQWPLHILKVDYIFKIPKQHNATRVELKLNKIANMMENPEELPHKCVKTDKSLALEICPTSNNVSPIISSNFTASYPVKIFSTHIKIDLPIWLDFSYFPQSYVRWTKKDSKYHKYGNYKRNIVENSGRWPTPSQIRIQRRWL